MSIADNWVDCSSNNPLPNIAAYKAAGHKHLCRKVSEGVGYHWWEGDGVTDQAHAAGLTVGHYHWLRPDAQAGAQADYFISMLAGRVMPGDVLMTDFERSPVPDLPDAAQALLLAVFNQRVRSAYPDNPLHVYTGNWYLEGHPACIAECRKWPVVMSSYTATLANPYGLDYVAWQFTDHATVAGFSAPVDYNRWLVTPQGDDMSAADVKAIIDDIHPALGRIQANIEQGQRDARNAFVTTASALSALGTRLQSLEDKVNSLSSGGTGVELVPTGTITLTPKDTSA